jgi:NADPH:quinone reductase-like Zn-dependent oxidoreductase
MTGSEVADRAATNDLPRRATASLRQPHLSRGEPLLLIGGGGSVGIIATQLAVAQGSP